MPATQYTYALKPVNTAQLEEEILADGLPVTTQGVVVDATTIYIVMSAALTAPQVTTLNAAVADHVPATAPGTGTTAYTDEDAQDAAAALFAAGTHSGITFVYNDAAGSLSATVTGGGTILDGEGAPAAGTGTEGDYYEDTAAGVLYGPRAAGGYGAEQRPTITSPAPTTNSTADEAGMSYTFASAGRVTKVRYQRQSISDATLTLRAWNDATQAVTTLGSDTQSTTGAFEITLATPLDIAAGESWTFTTKGNNSPSRSGTATVTNTADVTFSTARSGGGVTYPATVQASTTYYLEPTFEPGSGGATWPVAVRQLPAGSVTRAMLADSAAVSVIGRGANSSGVPADIAAAADGHVLRRASGVLGFGALDLADADAVTGILDETSGGTGQGAVAAGDLLYGSAANTWGRRALGGPGQILTMSGGTPTWVDPATATLADNSVTGAKLRDSAALSVIGCPANTPGDPVDIVAGTDGQVLRRAGIVVGFGALNLASTGAITGHLPEGNIADGSIADAKLSGAIGVIHGGTSITTYATGDILYASAADTLGKRAIGTAGQRLEVSGGVPAWKGAHGCSVVRGAALACGAGANNVVPFDVERTDTDTYYSAGAPSRVTIPAGLDGFYLVAGFMSWASSASGTRYLYFLKNGTAQAEVTQTSGAVDLFGRSTQCAVIVAAAGDYIELGVNSSVALSLSLAVFHVWKIA